MNRSEIEISEPWALAHYDSGYDKGRQDQYLWQMKHEQGWTDITECTPLVGQVVLCLDCFGEVGAGSYSGPGAAFTRTWREEKKPGTVFLEQVTHWKDYEEA